MPIPAWLRLLSLVSVSLGVLSAVITALDLLRRSQKMWIMNVVWPLTAVWSGPLGMWAYYAVGRAAKGGAAEQKPFWQSVGVGATHCGSGCTLADLIVEWSVLLFPVTLFGSPVFGTWLIDFAVAFLIGIAFQYFTIAPMRHLPFWQGLWAALKADTLSLSAWQLGMYGWMALALFVFFSPTSLPKTGPVFWFMMQIAMLFGFLTSYPVNWWLLAKGLKEKM